MSAYEIAGRHVTAALDDAASTGIEPELLLRAVLGLVAERYRELRGAEDLRAVLQHQLDNSEGDEDHMFMRP